MQLTVPALIIYADTPSLIEVNAQPVGEASPASHIALPVSDSGDYYITAAPLYDSEDMRRYSITRKLSLEEGAAPQGGEVGTRQGRFTWLARLTHRAHKDSGPARARQGPDAPPRPSCPPESCYP
jgi:hypothetical protein